MTNETDENIRQEIEEIREVFKEQALKRATCYLILQTALELTAELRANDRQLRARLRHLRDALCPSAPATDKQPNQTDQEDKPDQEVKTPVIITNTTTGRRYGWRTAPAPVLDNITLQLAQGLIAGTVTIQQPDTSVTAYKWRVIRHKVSDLGYDSEMLPPE